MPFSFTRAPLLVTLALGCVAAGCASVLPAPYATKGADALFVPGGPSAPEDTGGEGPGPQEPGTLLGALQYGERDGELDCAFTFEVQGAANPDVTCPYCDLRWGYDVTYTDATEPFSDECLRLPTISAYAGRYDYLTSLFQNYGPTWVLGDRSSGPYMVLGVSPDAGYYDYYGYSYYSYFRTFVATYDVSFDETSGQVDWEFAFGGYSYYYGYYDYDYSAVTFISGSATVR
jgi:hypothetical protein